MNIIDEFKSLDPKQPGNWPWPFKAAAFIGIFVALQVGAYFLFWQGQMDDIEKGANTLLLTAAKLAGMA